jgi:hypothetical protein
LLPSYYLAAAAAAAAAALYLISSVKRELRKVMKG